MYFKGKIPHRANHYPQNGEHCLLGVFKMNESPMGIHSSDGQAVVSCRDDDAPGVAAGPLAQS